MRVIVLSVVCAALAVPAAKAGGLNLEYSTFLGGDGLDYAYDVAPDSSGQAYVTGGSSSDDFPRINPYQNSRAGNHDVTVCKFSSSGSVLLYSTYVGGAGSDYGYGIEFDADGRAYVAGTTASTDFPTVDPYQASFAGGYDFIAFGLSSSGSALLFSTYFGGSDNDYGFDLGLAGGGELYIAGYAASLNFPTLNAYQATSGGGSGDAVAAKFSSTGSVLLYSTYLGGVHLDRGRALFLDSSGRVYLAGDTASANFPTLNALQASHAGPATGEDVFASLLSSTGTALVYSTYLGGTGYDAAYGVGANADGEAHITGYTSSTDLPVLNPYQASFAEGTRDAFAARLGSSGSTLGYCTYLGGGGYDYGQDIAVSSSGLAYLTGYTNSTDFPVSDFYQGSCAGDYDAFLSVLSSSGSGLAASSYLGGTYEDQGRGMSLLAGNRAFVVGNTQSSSFPTLNAYQRSYRGAIDAFVSKLSYTTPTPTPSPSATPTATPTPSPTAAPTASPTPEPSASPSPAPSATAVPTPPPTPVPSPSPSPTPWRLVVGAGDYDGDGTADPAVWRASDATWRILDISLIAYGLSADIPAPGDYDADGTADIAVFRPSAGRWWLRNPGGSGSLWYAYFGAAGDVPVPADYDGDFRTDTAIWRPRNGYWAIKSQTRFYYGASGDLPVPGDYDGDGTAEAAVYRHGAGCATWYVRSLTHLFYGQPGDIPVPGDYDGDGAVQFSVFRPSYGRWYIRGAASANFGQSGDIPFPMEADGDGTADRALYRPSTGGWYVYNLTLVSFGASADQPLH